jgi:hypothetical protein
MSGCSYGRLIGCATRAHRPRHAGSTAAPRRLIGCATPTHPGPARDSPGPVESRDSPPDSPPTIAPALNLGSCVLALLSGAPAA